jgi:hypothetical protein
MGFERPVDTPESTEDEEKIKKMAETKDLVKDKDE